MKSKWVVVSCLLGGIILSMGHEYSSAATEGVSGRMKIGSVSVRKIFLNSQRSAAYRREVTAERQRTEAKLAELNKEIEIEEAGMKMLDTGSSDYLAKFEKILKKRADLQTEKDFYTKRVSLKEQKTTEDLYKDILDETRAIAKEKGFDLVMEMSEPDFPSTSPTQLEMSIGTHKVLYCAGCIDISDEVMTRVDAKANVKK